MSRGSRERVSNAASGSAKPRTLRCAIYTRVSTDQGLEQDFNSLDAQREACAAYIRSQAQEGWVLIQTPYDDGGYSGGNLDRPALKALLEAVAAKRIDVIVVYKVDRLTRSLADFAKLVDAFDAAGVSFISITQSFNTTTSMGRLTLNMLLSFAQFEREVTGERIRDKIAASKKKGIWVGGVVPLGYRVVDRKLVVDELEAKTVRFIFDRYLELGSLGALIDELRQKGIVTRVRTLATGRVVGGVPFTRGPLAYILKNGMYLGKINHGPNSYPGEHAALGLPVAATAASSDSVRMSASAIRAPCDARSCEVARPTPPAAPVTEWPCHRAPWIGSQVALFTEDTAFYVYMDSRSPEPTYVLHGRSALAPVFADLNQYQATTHFNGQSTIRLDGGGDRRKLLLSAPPEGGRRHAHDDDCVDPLLGRVREPERRSGSSPRQAHGRLDRNAQPRFLVGA